jgi:hypothetical protein
LHSSSTDAVRISNEKWDEQVLRRRSRLSP